MSMLTATEQNTLDRMFRQLMAEQGYREDALGGSGFGELFNSLQPLPALVNDRVLGVVDGELAWVVDAAGSTGNYVFDDDAVDLDAAGTMAIGGANTNGLTFKVAASTGFLNIDTYLPGLVDGYRLIPSSNVQIGMFSADAGSLFKVSNGYAQALSGGNELRLQPNGALMSISSGNWEFDLATSAQSVQFKTAGVAIGYIKDDGAAGMKIAPSVTAKYLVLQDFDGTGYVKLNEAIGTQIGYGASGTRQYFNNTQIGWGFGGVNVGTWESDGASGIKWQPDSDVSTFIKSGDASHTAWLEIKQSRANLVCQGGNDGFFAANGEVYIKVGSAVGFALLANTTKLLASGHEGVHVQWDGADTKLGFYGTATVAKQSLAAAPTAAQIATVLANLGLVTLV